MSETLKQKTAKGLFWGAMNSGMTQVLNIVIGIVLARYLSQTDYGIVGVLSIFITIATSLQTSGFTQALVNLSHPTARDYNSVFSFNVLMSATMYAVLFVCAPWIADFFHQPCLVGVSRVVFLSFLIASLGITPGAYMTKHMMNREYAILAVVSLVVSGAVGVTLAIIRQDYWALAWQQLTYICISNLGRYCFLREWRPHFTLDFGPVRRMFAFGVKILVTTIVNALSTQILTVIFGRTFTMHQVGNYSQAFKWDTMASSLVSNTVGQIAQAMMVAGRDEATDDPMARQLRIFRKMVRFTCFLSMPLMMGFALISEEFIHLSIGQEWVECVPLLQVLCLSGAFMPLYTMYQNLAISQSRSDVYMWLNMGQIVVQIAVILAFHNYGMFVMVCAYSAFLIVWLLPWHVFAGRLIGYHWWDACCDVAPFCLAAIVVMGTTWVATHAISSPVLLILARCSMAAVLYYALMKVARVQILRECEDFVWAKIRVIV